MLPYRHSVLTRILIGLFFVGVIGYSYYEIRGMLYGPSITLPAELVQSNEQFISITGKAERIATLRMNGTAITVTEDGAFNEPYLLSPGLNRIVFDAEDKYGNDRQEVLQVVYTPLTPAPEEPPATSTPSATSTLVAPSTE